LGYQAVSGNEKIYFEIKKPSKDTVFAKIKNKGEKE